MWRSFRWLFIFTVMITVLFSAACGDDDDDDNDVADDDSVDDDVADDDMDDDAMDDDAIDDDAIDDDVIDDDAVDDDTTTDDDTVDDDVIDDDTAADDDTVIIDEGALIPGTGEPGFDPDLETKALRYAQQFHGLVAVPFGMSLEADISDLSYRVLVDDWLTNSDLDENFEEYTGTHPYDIVDQYGEFGDLGMFGGMASLGDVFRYALVRDEGTASKANLDELRQNVIDLMDALHICVDIVGDTGVIVRGLRPRGLPGGDPETLPLFDLYGNPLPLNKTTNEWREDNSVGGLYPDWIWEDNTSKDQLDGFVLSMGAVWDVVADDPDISQDLKERLQADAASIGDKLMIVAPETGLYLSIRDADGRLTRFHDLHPLELEGIVLPPLIGNGFNSVMALGVIKTIAFITGGQRFKDFFDELIEQEDFLRYVDQTYKFVNVGPYTNWSNINMAFCAIYPLLRYEAENDLFEYWQAVLQDDLWDSYFPGWPVSRTHQGYFAVIHAAFAQDGTDNTAADWAAEDLSGFPVPPYWNAPYIENCDEDEIAAGVCLAVDGTTVIELAGIDIGGQFYFWPGHGDDPQAQEPVPRNVRPPSNFNWRSSPYEVNGGGGWRLNPGGDFHGAYWFGRYLRRGNTARINVSSNAW